MIAEPFEFIQVKNAGEKALKHIDDILAEEMVDSDRMDIYRRVGDWVNDALHAVMMPDPSTRAIKTDWNAEFEKKRNALQTGDVGQLRENTEKDLLELEKKFYAFNALQKDGRTLIEDITTEGLIAKDDGGDDAIDYRLLSILGDIRNVAAYVQSNIGPMNELLTYAGPTQRKLAPELRSNVDALGDEMGAFISALTLSAATSNGAAGIARDERKLTRKISLEEGEAYMNLAIDNLKISDIADYIEKAIKQLKRHRDCKYAEVRIKDVYGKGAYAIDGKTRGSGEGADMQIGVKVIASEGDAEARGDYGGEFSLTNLSDFQVQEKVSSALVCAYMRAKANAAEKTATKEELIKSKGGSILAESMENTSMAEIPAVKDTVYADYETHPMAENMQGIIEYVEEISKEAGEFDSSVNKNIVYAVSMQERHLFINSNGSRIDESNVITEGGYFVVAQKDGRMPDFLYESIGGEGGFEVLRKGRNGLKKTLRDFVLKGTRDTVQMAGAEFFPEELADGTGTLEVHERDGVLYTDGTIIPADKEKGNNKHTIILDNSAVTLPMHEILPGISHRGEGDRVTGESNNEAGYTDDGNFFSNNIGKQVASPLITAYVDATDPGLGHRHYDDQGKKTKKHVLLDRGILVNFLNDLETASILGLEPNASSFSTEASKQPLIRMSCTAIENGKTPPAEMMILMGMGDSHSGYIFKRSRTPAITAGRGNGYFDMMCAIPVVNGKLVYDENTGEPKVYRGTGIMGDTPEIWGSDVWAVGNDAVSHSLFNCGKGRGDMQAKRVEHYGPSIGTEAYIIAGTDNAANIASAEAAILGYAKSFGNKSLVMGGR